MKRAIWIVAIVVVLGGAYWWWEGSPALSSYDSSTVSAPLGTGTDSQAPTIPTTIATPGTPNFAAGTFTMVQVATHNSAESCWSLVDGNVYDLTAWISQHPGGERAIKGMCGKDGTEAFHGQHGDSKKQAEMLATMQIGTLSK